MEESEITETKSEGNLKLHVIYADSADVMKGGTKSGRI